MISNDMKAERREIECFFKKEETISVLEKFHSKDRVKIREDISCIALRVLEKAQELTEKNITSLKETKIKTCKFLVKSSIVIRHKSYNNKVLISQVGDECYEVLLKGLFKHLGLNADKRSCDTLYEEKTVSHLSPNLKKNCLGQNNIYLYALKKFTIDVSWNSANLQY